MSNRLKVGQGKLNFHGMCEDFDDEVLELGLNPEIENKFVDELSLLQN